MAARTAYKNQAGPRVVTRGSVSNPSDPKGTFTRAVQQGIATDGTGVATPTVVSRGSVSNPKR